jgi:solute carrier family 25 protein 34/35
LQGELQSKAEAPRLYKGVLHGVGTILKNEGARGLFRGLGSAVRLKKTKPLFTLAKSKDERTTFSEAQKKREANVRKSTSI